MKKKWKIIIPVIVSVIAGIIFLLFPKTAEEKLSEDEINALRADYKVYNEENPLVDYKAEYYNQTVRDYVKNADTFVYCEVSADAFFEESTVGDIKNIPVKVICDTEGILPEGFEFAFIYGILNEGYSPSPEKGEKAVIPIHISFYDDEIQFGSSKNGYYYVTDDGFVLAAFEERGTDVYTGLKLENLLSKLKKTHSEKTEYINLNKEHYQKSNGFNGFENLESFKNRINEFISE